MDTKQHHDRASSADPVITAIARYRVARIAYEDAAREADEARDAVDCMIKRPSIAVTSANAVFGRKTQRALTETNWPTLARHANELRNALYRAELSVLWTLARSPAGIGHQVRLMADEIARSREDQSFDALGLYLWARAREFLEPFAKTIERSALRLAGARAKAALA